MPPGRRARRELPAICPREVENAGVVPVSYTHLDVYKRQAMGGINKAGAFATGVAGGIAGNMIGRTFGPVSYTHLDVYKRQVYAMEHGGRT